MKHTRLLAVELAVCLHGGAKLSIKLLLCAVVLRGIAGVGCEVHKAVTHVCEIRRAKLKKRKTYKKRVRTWSSWGCTQMSPLFLMSLVLITSQIAMQCTLEDTKNLLVEVEAALARAPWPYMRE